MIDRSIDEWLDYIQTLHVRSIEMDLQRVAAVWERFEMDITMPVITVAGTNGKGSSVAMLDAIYREAGYRTGAYTSPHLVHYNERICIEGQAIDDASLLAGFAAVEDKRADIPLTFFEFGTVLALYCLCQKNVDVLLLEVGLGGRLDATNIVDNDVALITSISVDHTAWLGDNREVIAAEKAGIIKPQGQVVCADPRPPKAIAHRAKQQQATLWQRDSEYFVDVDSSSKRFSWRNAADLNYRDLQLNLPGTHQVDNAAGVIAVVECLQATLPVQAEAIKAGLNKITIVGRQQWLTNAASSGAHLLFDVSHNDDSIAQLLDTLVSKRAIMKDKGRVHAVFGALSDKDIAAAIAQLLPVVDAWHLASIGGERGQSATELKQLLMSDLCPHEATALAKAETYSEIKQAYEGALLETNSNDIVLIFGSFHVVGDIIAHLQQS